jgi:hypothetical protein
MRAAVKGSGAGGFAESTGGVAIRYSKVEIILEAARARLRRAQKSGPAICNSDNRPAG